MKLKKAMRLYPIQMIKDGYIETRYILGEKFIYEVWESPGFWWNNVPDDMKHYTEKEAVAWLIEGADKREPIEITHDISVVLDGQQINFISECPYCGHKLP